MPESPYEGAAKPCDRPRQNSAWSRSRRLLESMSRERSKLCSATRSPTFPTATCDPTPHPGVLNTFVFSLCASWLHRGPRRCSAPSRGIGPGYYITLMVSRSCSDSRFRDRHVVSAGANSARPARRGCSAHPAMIGGACAWAHATGRAAAVDRHGGRERPPGWRRSSPASSDRRAHPGPAGRRKKPSPSGGKNRRLQRVRFRDGVKS